MQDQKELIDEQVKALKGEGHHEGINVDDNVVDVIEEIHEKQKLKKAKANEATKPAIGEAAAGEKVHNFRKRDLRKLLREDVRKQAREQLKASTPSILNKLEIPFMISGTMFLAYFVAYFNFPIGWLFLLIGTFLYVYMKRVRAFTVLLTTQIQRDAMKKRVDGHLESCEWINLMVSRVWGVYEPVLSSQIFDTVNTILEGLCPPFLSAIRLETLSLGSEAPQLLGAMAYRQTERDVIHLDVEVLFVPKVTNPTSFMHPLRQTNHLEYASKVVLVTRIGKGKLGIDIPVAVEGIAVHAKARLELSLMAALPVVKVAELSLREQPRVDFILKPLKSLDIMDLPGLSSWLHAIIRTVTGSILVDPNRITVNVDEIVNQARMSSERSFAVLRLVIYGANIYEQPGISGDVDPFIVVVKDGKTMARTPTIMDNWKPVWNEEFFLLISNENSVVQMEVFHTGVLRKDKLLGSFPLRVRDVQEGSFSHNSSDSLEEKPSVGGEPTSPPDESSSTYSTPSLLNPPSLGHFLESYKCSGSTKGQIDFGCSLYRTIPAEQVKFPISENYVSGILRLCIHQVKEIVLKGSVARPMSLYTEISVVMLDDNDELEDAIVLNAPPLATFKTKVKKSTNSPVYESRYDVFVKDLSVTFVVARVYETATDVFGVDLGKDSLVGYSILSLYSFFGKAADEDNSTTTVLAGGNASGSIAWTFNFDPFPWNLSSIPPVCRPFQPSIGLCRVMLLEGRDFHSSTLFSSKSKLYVKVSISGSGEVFTTRPTVDLSTPIFMKETLCLLKSKRQTLSFEVYCVGGKFGSDSLVGTFEYVFDKKTALETLRDAASVKEQSIIEDVVTDSKVAEQVSTPQSDKHEGSNELAREVLQAATGVGDRVAASSLDDTEVLRAMSPVAPESVKSIAKFESVIDEWVEVKGVASKTKENTIIGSLHVKLIISFLDDAHVDEAGDESEDHKDIPSNCGILVASLKMISGLPKKAFRFLEFASSFSDYTFRSAPFRPSEEDDADAGRFSHTWNNDEKVEIPIVQAEQANVIIRLYEGKDTRSFTAKLLHESVIPFEDFLKNERMHLDDGVSLNLSHNYKNLPLLLPPDMVVPVPALFQLTLLSGSSLMAMDSSGTSDPFVIFKLNGFKLEKSKTHKKTLDPEWNESVDYALPDLRSNLISLHVFDWNRIEYSAPMGSLVLYPDEFKELLNSQSGKVLSFPLINASTGHLQLQIQLLNPEDNHERYDKAWKKYAEVAMPESGIITGMALGAASLVTGGASGAAAVVAGTAVGASKMAAGATVEVGKFVGGTALGAGRLVGGTALEATELVGETALGVGKFVGGSALGAGKFVGETALGAGNLVSKPFRGIFGGGGGGGKKDKEPSESSPPTENHEDEELAVPSADTQKSGPDEDVAVKDKHSSVAADLGHKFTGLFKRKSKT